MKPQTQRELRALFDTAAKETALYGAALELQGEDSCDVRRTLLHLLENPDLALVPQTLNHLPPLTDDIILDDVSYRLFDVMERSVMGSESSPGIDLSQIASSSPVAWMTSVLKTAVGRVHSSVRRDRHGEITAPTDLLAQLVVAPVYRGADLSYEELLVEHQVAKEEELADIAIARILGTSQEERVLVGAAGLHSAFSIPPISVPSTRFARENLAAACEQHPHLLHASLVEAASAEPSRRSGPMRELWEHFSPEQASILLGRDSGVTVTIVTAALLPRLRPSVRTISRVTALLRQASRVPGWNAVAKVLIAAWLNEFYASYSAYNRTNADPVQGDSHTDSEMEWTQAAFTAINFSGTPLGAQVTCPQQVDLFLRAILAEFRN